MLKINFTKRKKQRNEEQFASEVVEILEEKLDEMNFKLPKKVLDRKDGQIKFCKDLREEY